MLSDVGAGTIDIDGALVHDVRTPDSVGELQATLQEISAARQTAVVVGGGTRLVFGNVGGPFEVAISTRNLNRILQYEPDNMTIAVEPGCTIGQIRDLLAGDLQTIALDAAHDGRSTIGGAYATGMSGPRRLGGGSLKDWVIGVEVAGPDGVIAKAGGMVVKNVTGFDMMHLHYGALGAFGVVTRLNLKVFPAPSASRSIELTFSTPEPAYDAGIALLRSQLQPASILCWNDARGWHVSARCDAPEAAMDRLVERMLAVASAKTAADGSAVCDGGDAAVRPFTSLVDLTVGDIVVRLPVTASRQPSVVGALAEAGWQVCADLGSGLIYARRPPDKGFDGLSVDLANTATWLALPPDLKADRDVFGPTPPSVQPILRRLKDSFDPDRRLNRGRFVLGL